ncbi:MAG: hypothetical protein AAGC56_01055 [Pseudomonadota bacterium]
MTGADRGEASNADAAPALSPDLAAAAEFAFARAFDGVLEILIDADQPVRFWVDGRSQPPTVSTHAPAGEAARCVWRAGPATMERVLTGERAFVAAYLSGRLDIRGDMAVMARLIMENQT